MEEHPHAGFLGVFAAGGQSAFGAASGVHGGKFKIFALRGSRSRRKARRKSRGASLCFIMTSLIIALGLVD